MGIWDRLRQWADTYVSDPPEDIGEQQSRTNANDLLGLLTQQRLGSSSLGSVPITQESSLRHSAVWACLTLRADLISTMPIDVFRRIDGIQVEVTKPPLLVEPAPGMNSVDWLRATQFDLDRYGNTFGIILERDAFGLPRSVQLVPAGEVSVKIRNWRPVEYKICGDDYSPSQIWHERQNVTAGNPMGLCPVSYAAWSIGNYLSAQKFGNDFFANGGVPGGLLQNTELPVDDAAITDEIARRWYAMVENRGVAVMGKGWEWHGASVPEAANAFLEDMKYGAADVCRFFGVPADLVDAGTGGANITYANVTQRNLQFLVMNLGPAITRREAALTAALPQPRYVKLNTDALLRMDPETRARVINAQVATRVLAPDEARELDNRPPMTEEQMAQLERLLPTKIVHPKMELTA